MKRIRNLFSLLRNGPKGGEGAAEIWQSTFVIGFVVTIFGVIGLAAIFLWGYGLSQATGAKPANLWQIISADVLVAGAAAAVGSLLGFVFAIPRTLDPASRVAVASAVSQQGPIASSQAALASNTNLERISDWLTTLLIGAALVQVKSVAEWIGKLGEKLATGTLQNENLVPFIIIYFASLSFTGIYLITRLYLTYALQQTLYLLTGSLDQRSIRDLKADMSDALATSTVEDLTRVRDEFLSWKFVGNEGSDPSLNCLAVRVFVPLLAANAMEKDRPVMIEKLKSAVQQAAASPAVKKQLFNEITSSRLSTGIADVDSAIKEICSG